MTLDISPVASRRDFRQFVDLPWQVYNRKDHPQWIPPLRLMVKEALDTRKNPFYRRADRELFLARRDGRVVGRIAAIQNRAHNEFHGDRVGFFGFFECLDDQDAATGLLGAAAKWLQSRGLDAMRGPMSPSTNHECGLLVRGFRFEPTFLTPWNPRYYATLMEGAGLTGVKDLLAYFIPMADERFTLPPEFEEHAMRALQRSGVTFRDLDLRRFDQEIELCWEVYNSAWDANWGFVPMTREEFLYMAKELRPLLIPDFAFFAEVNGAPAGFMIVVPDFNQIFKHIRSGRLLPTGIIKLLLGKKRLRSGRLILLGVKREYRTRSIFQLFGHEVYRRGRAYGAVGAEASWVLEDNELMNKPLRALGAKEYRRWRIFERTIDG